MFTRSRKRPSTKNIYIYKKWNNALRRCARSYCRIRPSLEAAATASRVAPLIAEYPSHLVPRYRVRPAARPAGYRAGEDAVKWHTGAFVEAPYCDGWWTGYVISNKGDSLHHKLNENAGNEGRVVEGRETGDVQVAFLKPPVGEGGYGYYWNRDLRGALEWDGSEWSTER